MTTIAFDGATLAVDNASWHGNTWNKVNKLFAFPPNPNIPIIELCNTYFWWAAAGPSGYIYKVKGWLDGNIADFPYYPEQKDFSLGLVVVSSKTFYEFTGYGTLVPHHSIPYAEGCGREMALGAMLAGADSVRAVEIVSERSCSAAAGVTYVTIPSRR